MKTASRIVGTAGFLAGYQCQDSPVYGAERRGAAVAAFTRLSDSLIQERGAITAPDLIVCADETLLKDPSAAVLAGQEYAGVIFVNSERGETLNTEYGIQTRLVTFDLTGRTLAVLGRASALSAGLAAAAARLCGLIEKRQLVEALREEFGSLHVTSDEVDKNAQVAEEVFDRVPTISWSRCPASAVPAVGVARGLVRLGYQEPLLSAPTVVAPGNAALRKTGTWRVERPVIDRAACTRCGLCFVECPDGVIALDAEGYPVIDYDHCKGCLICRQVCPVEAIRKERETRAW